MEVWIFKNKYMCFLNLCLKIYRESERRKKGERDVIFNSYNNYI